MWLCLCSVVRRFLLWDKCPALAGLSYLESYFEACVHHSAVEDPSSCPHPRHRMQELMFGGSELYVGSGSPEKTTHSFPSHSPALPMSAPSGSVCEPQANLLTILLISLPLLGFFIALIILYYFSLLSLFLSPSSLFLCLLLCPQTPVALAA